MMILETILAPLPLGLVHWLAIVGICTCCLSILAAILLAFDYLVR